MAPYTDRQTRLALSEHPSHQGQAAPWIGPLVALGARAARYRQNLADRQLVITISVPKRDFAAVLIGCGWVITSEAPTLSSPLELLREMKREQPIRAVNINHVIVGHFMSLNEAVTPPQAQFAESTWQVDSIRALVPLQHPVHSAREPRLEPKSIEHMAHMDRFWDARLALPAADLALIGTHKWLEQDMETYLTKEGDTLPPSSVRELLKPKNPKAATWFTHLLSAAHLADHLPLSSDFNAVILDGNGAIKYLGDIEVPVVICVLDRSASDDSAAELLIQLRNTRGKPISPSVDLGWAPPAGIEAMAFTVPL